MLFSLLQVSFSSNFILKQSILRATRSAATISLLLLSGNISTTARAWSSNTVSSGSNNNGLVGRTTRNWAPTHSGFGPSSHWTALAAAPTNDNDSSENGQTPKPLEGKTGWNHNPPKNPDFYSSSSSSSTLVGAAQEVEAIAKELAANDDTAKPKFRTGWLHNQESAETKAETAQTSSSSTQKSSAAGKARRRLEEAMKAQRENHRIVSPGTLYACGKDRQIVVTEHRMSVPLVHPDDESETNAADGSMPSFMAARTAPTQTIDVAFNIVEEIQDEETRKWYESVFPTLTPTQRAAAYVKRCAMTSAEDMLLYLQGGPGFGAPTPVVALDFSKGGGSWGSAALDRYRRVVLMDQRGTGKSSPLTKQSLERRFPDLFALDDIANANVDGSMDACQQSHPEEFQKFQDTVPEATEFMAQFRADSIVRDAELIRKVLMYTPSVDDEEQDATKNEYDPSSPNPWGCVLGQSFGGFCTMTYLSQIQHPPKICLLTGGIAPMLADSAVDVYTSLWKKVKERNLRYYDMYPGDVAVVKSIVRQLLKAENDGATPRLPSGGKLTARRFLQLGMMLGGSPSCFASMHELLSSAFLQPISNKDDTMEFSRGFLKAVDHAQPFDEYPIYFWLHESIYACGNSNHLSNLRSEKDDVDLATNWSADAAFETKINARSSDAAEYDYKTTSREDIDLPVLFFGEMIFPWMTEDYDQCGGLGCTALANALAKKKDWGPLYDGDHMRAVLEDGRSRSAAAVYYEDMYVDFDLSMKVASRGGPLEKCKVYITNDYQHSGIRDDGAAIFNKLHGMATGSIRTPS